MVARIYWSRNFLTYGIQLLYHRHKIYLVILDQLLVRNTSFLRLRPSWTHYFEVISWKVVTHFMCLISCLKKLRKCFTEKQQSAWAIQKQENRNRKHGKHETASLFICYNQALSRLYLLQNDNTFWISKSEQLHMPTNNNSNNNNNTLYYSMFWQRTMFFPANCSSGSCD